jgi:ATP-dependent protease ClpP protease subunit
VDLYIYGVIGDEGITSKQVIDQLQGVDEVTVHINSQGGEVFAGFAIANTLATIPNSTAIIEGVCASIATVIASSCKIVKMHSNAQYMIHNASVGISGNKSELQKSAAVLSAMDEKIIDSYNSRISIPERELVKMMDAETWMSAEEALAKGFVDEIIEPKYKAVASINFNTNDMKFLDLVKNALSGAKNMIEMKLADGKAVVIEAEPGQEVGASVTVEGQPAPVGEHALEGGKVLVVTEAGKVAEIKEAQVAPAEPVEDKMKELEKAILEIAAKVNSFANVKPVDFEAKLSEAITSLKAEIKTGHRPDKKAVDAVTTKMSPADNYLNRNK